MFVIKYDKLSMIKLVQSIKKYPAIYDTNNHFSKEDLDLAWDNVALEVGEKDSLCRDRWHSIKSCYTRHLKFTAINSKRKPYYLAEYLDFMLPFLTDKISKFLNQKQQIEDYPKYLKEALAPSSLPFNRIYQTEPRRVLPEVKTEILEVNDNEDEWLNVTLDYPQPSSSKGLDKRVSHSSGKVSCKRRKTHNKPHTEDEDVHFFKNLLPEIARMSSHQKLKFKQETLSIIEDVLYASEDINITE